MIRKVWTRVPLVFLMAFATFPASPHAVFGRNPVATAQVTTGGGLHTVHVNTEDVSVVLYLPEDLISGEPVSGRILASPRGLTDKQRRKAARRLEGTTLEVGGVVLPVESNPIHDATVCSDLRCESRSELGPLAIPVRLRHRKGNVLAEVWLPLTPPMEASSPGYRYRPVGVTGLPMAIRGSFDGDSAGTHLEIHGRKANVLAESPRRVMAEVPEAAVGAGLLELREDGRRHTGPFRGLGVALQPGKPALQPGERTTLTLRILGLDHLGTEMPVQIVSRDPERVLLESGAVHTLRIHPTELQTGGVYQWIGTLQGSGGGPVDVAVSTHHSRPEQRLVPKASPGS